MNRFLTAQEDDLQILRISPKLEQEQVSRVREVRRKRDQARCSTSVEQLRKAATAPNENLMPYILDAVRGTPPRARSGAMVDVFGLYTEQAII